MKRISILFFVAASFLCFYSSIEAQVIIATGAGAPAPSLVADCYWDSLGHRAWLKQDAAWRIWGSEDLVGISSCNEIIIYQVNGGSLYFTTKYGTFIEGEAKYECLDQIMRIDYCFGDEENRNNDGCVSYFILDTTRLGYCVEPIDWKEKKAYQPIPDTLQGLKAYCITTSVAVSPYDLRNDIHLWGMLGMNGKWLIQPIFDSPFRFQDGFADVVYYGEKRTINEQGEFVDP